MAGARLMAVLPNPAATFLPMIYSGTEGGGLQQLLDKRRQARGDIRIYDLRPLLRP